jgi:acyl carrier protein
MKDRLAQILADTLGLPLSAIPADASMNNIAQWDSIAHLNLVMSLEQEFNVQFNAEEMIALDSLPAMQEALALRGIA